MSYCAHVDARVIVSEGLSKLLSNEFYNLQSLLVTYLPACLLACLLTYSTSSHPGGRLRPFEIVFNPSRSFAAAVAPAQDFQSHLFPLHLHASAPGHSRSATITINLYCNIYDIINSNLYYNDRHKLNIYCYSFLSGLLDMGLSCLMPALFLRVNNNISFSIVGTSQDTE